MEEPGKLQSMGHEELDTTKWLHTAQSVWAYQAVLVVENLSANSGDRRDEGSILM